MSPENVIDVTDYDTSLYHKLVNTVQVPHYLGACICCLWIDKLSLYNTLFDCNKSTMMMLEFAKGVTRTESLIDNQKVRLAAEHAEPNIEKNDTILCYHKAKSPWHD